MQIPGIRLPDRRLFAGIAIGVFVGVIAVGAVTAASPSAVAPLAATGATGPTAATGATGPSASAGTKSTANTPGIKLARLRQAIGANFRVTVQATNRNGTHDLLYVRGSLAVSPTSVTVTLPDNSTQTIGVDSSTVVREQGKTVAYSSLENGERAMVFASKNSDGSWTAKLIRCVKEAAAPAATATP